jgi:hypothetical protein
MSAREIIADELLTNGLRDDWVDVAADNLLSALHAAGYRLIGPSELASIETALEYAERPLANDLEVGFRHRELSPKEKLERYADCCRFIAADLRAALKQKDGGNG